MTTNPHSDTAAELEVTRYALTYVEAAAADDAERAQEILNIVQMLPHGSSRLLSALSGLVLIALGSETEPLEKWTEQMRADMFEIEADPPG